MIGKTLAHYQVVEILGMGGMEEVFRAWDQEASTRCGPIAGKRRFS